jgi:eukaryotic-like serine/threonine-protein kinase
VGDAARVSKRTCPRCNKAFLPGDDAVFCPNDGTELEPRSARSSEAPPHSDPYIGTIIHGDIEIRGVAGAGAMGRVYRAHQRGIDRDVAVKILHRELSGNTSLVQRFHREGKIASRLQHPHVVDVYLAGQLPDGALYIAREYLDGKSLAAATQASGGLFSLERALPILLQICDAVGEGHARGIVHRDLKPENVMLVRRADTGDWVKVLDFGIAKVNLGEQSMETAAGLIFGTARYISPEGAQGATVGPAGDVYSIAVILYQLLAGRTPFDAEQPVGLLIKHIHDQPPPLRSWPSAAGVPEPIVRVIMDNLAKDPARRAPTARALGSAIANAAKEANVSFSDIGVVARMSMLDVTPPRKSGESSAPEVLEGRARIEPTLDDVTPPPALKILTSTTAPLPLTPPTPLASGTRATDALADTTADGLPPPQISKPPATVPSAHPTSSSAAAAKPASIPPRSDSARHGRRTRTSPTLLTALAFLLGVALTALGMQYAAGREDNDKSAHVERARRALASGRYVDPPGDSVRDHVRSGLARWPDDTDFVKIQSDAAHEVVTRAMAARSGGDVAGARDLAKTAQDLDPTDGTAKLLLAQYEDELAASGENGSGGLGGPRVTLDVPLGRARPGGRAELVARIFVGQEVHDVGRPQFTITGPGLAGDGLTLPAIAAAEPRVNAHEGGTHRPTVYKATFSPPREGSYDVEFEANVDGATVRAQRTLGVMK